MTEREEWVCAQEAPKDQTYVLEGLLYPIARVCVCVLGYRCTSAFFFSPHLCPLVDEQSRLVHMKLPPWPPPSPSTSALQDR